MTEPSLAKIYNTMAILAVFGIASTGFHSVVNLKYQERMACRETIHYARLADHIGMSLTEEEKKEVEECRR